MMRGSPVRRLTLIGVALSVSTLLLHGQIADALVARGDAELYRGRWDLAARYYERASFFDAEDGVAVDRFCFVSMTFRSSANDSRCIAMTDRYLKHRPQDATVRFDRAMILRRNGKPGLAFVDFVTVGRQERDGRAFALAGIEPAKMGRNALARVMWKRALVFAPNLPIAMHRLAAYNR